MRVIFSAQCAGISDRLSSRPVEEAAASACRELEIEKYYLDYKQLWRMEETDAVVIVSPHKYHCEIAACPRSMREYSTGKTHGHERPGMCANHGGSQDSGVKLQIGFMRRFDEKLPQAAKGQWKLERSAVWCWSNPGPRAQHPKALDV